MNITNAKKAEILIEALPYIKNYAGQTVVIKYGGSAMTDESLKKTVIKDIVQMVLAGKINKDLVALFGSMDAKAIGLCGIDGKMIEAERLNEELGYVGDVKKVDPKPIEDALNDGYIPVIAPVAVGNDGKVYNINADTAAARIAGALRAKAFINMTDEKGILKDKDDENSLIREVSASEAGELISEGIVSGGMMPKVRCCIDAIRRGVEKVFIIDGREPHSLLIEVLSDEGIGTMFY